MKTHSLLLISNANIVLENKIIRGTLLIQSGKIFEILSTKDDISKYNEYNFYYYDAKGHWIIPGLVDIHCHGGNNSSFMDCTFDDFNNILQFYLKQGTTSIFPTSLSCDDASLVDFLQAYNDYSQMANNLEYKSMLKGVHLEGPFLSTKNAGAQPKVHCRKPEVIKASNLLRQYPFIRRWTIAPEIDADYKLAEFLFKNKVLVSAGHTDVLYADMCHAFNHGYTHMTHLYSGMNSLVYIDGLRRAGAVEAALLTQDITVELIADGIHLPYPFIELVFKLKGADNIAIITDAMRGTGTKEKNSILGNRINGTPVILENGVAKLPDHTSLAGSITTLIDMLRRLSTNTKIPFVDIVKMCTYTPARIMNIHNSVGLIKKGYIADLIELDNQLNIINIIKNGKFI